MPHLSRRARPALACLVSTLLAPACREAEETSLSDLIAPSGLSASGCTGPDQTFTPPQTASAVALTTTLDASSQVTAAGDSETLFISAQGALVQIDVSGATPVETTLATPADLSAALSAFGFAGAPAPSALCVQNSAWVLVVDQASNSILRVSRATPGLVELFAGQPSATGGFADGFAIPVAGQPPSRFLFSVPAGLAVSGDGRVFVADSGNHAVRVVQQGFVSTLAGTGAAFFANGDLSAAGFDTPSGLTIRCGGSLLVSELGGASTGGGQRLRELFLGAQSFFGQSGSATSLAGNGTAATTQGAGVQAELFAPRSPLSTEQQDTYWVDSGSGILRRLRGSAEMVDCPLWADCASAGADFTPGALVSLTQTPAGVLYVLDAGATSLYRVTP